MGKKDDKKPSIQLKAPKGTRDWTGGDIAIRDRIFTAVTTVFKRHGATAFDTPVFELREILAGKYGEDSRLIYNLEDQGGEICSLRYDLTVPLARYLAMNKNIQHLKRYHIAKVYRRDQPAITKGRLREFFQCDFDIVGVYDPMIPDAEILSVIVEVFAALDWDAITIKLNHRKILDGLFAVAGVPADKTRTISSAVDKLDKLPWEEVRKEMTDEKGLDGVVADKIGEYVKLKGGRDLLDKLKADPALAANEDAQKGLSDMELLFSYMDSFAVTDKVSFDLSLARGLDYYTGLIFEVVTEGSAPAELLAAGAKKLSVSGRPAAGDEDRSNDPGIGVGSIAAGGRYDDLVGMFSGKRQIPCVGISFGVDRIFSVMKARIDREAKERGTGAKLTAPALRPSEVDVYVIALDMGKAFTGLLTERIRVARDLWTAGIRAEFSAKVKPKLPQQFTAAESAGAPLAVILREDEIVGDKARLKVLGLKLPEDHPDRDGRVVSRAELVSETLKELERLKS